MTALPVEVEFVEVFYNFVRPAEFADLFLQLRDPALVPARRPRSLTAVDLGLVHSVPQRLGRHPQLLGDPGHHPAPLTSVFCDRRGDSESTAPGLSSPRSKMATSRRGGHRESINIPGYAGALASLVPSAGC